MELVLKKKPKNPILIEGFPGFGLVGTIVTEYLIEHLSCEQIGKITFSEIQPTLAIHKGKLIEPMGVYYNKKYNVVILHAILPPKGYEWQMATVVSKIIKQLQVKETISIEGVASQGGNKLFCFNNKKFEKLGAEAIGESVIMGVTAAVLLNEKNVSCLFTETHSDMPDSRAAAQVIEFLDKYLGFKLDTKPLLVQAEIFESKVKNILSQTSKTQIESERKQMSYLG